MTACRLAAPAAGYGEQRVSETQAPETHAGPLLAGRYRLDRLIASGGMAQVWEATDEVLSRRVAVKLLHPHLAADATFVARFRREAVAAARLAHPSIVAIYDTHSDAEVEAIVMELVRGHTLRQELDSRPGRVLEPGEASAIVAQVAEALDVAHKAGVVHRDVKPGNVLLSEDGRVMVTDFGIAKALQESEGDLTVTGTTLGTVKYLAPEQVEGGPVDARTDVYALGVILYELVCGRPAVHRRQRRRRGPGPPHPGAAAAPPDAGGSASPTRKGHHARPGPRPGRPLRERR